MIRMRINFITRVLLVFLPLLVQGQKIRFYNSEQGLPNSMIHNVSQDDQGYIWIATENGTSYFDGMRFITFHHNPGNPGTLASNLVKTVYTDSRGVTWVGTSNGLQIARITHSGNFLFNTLPSQILPMLFRLQRTGNTISC